MTRQRNTPWHWGGLVVLLWAIVSCQNQGSTPTVSTQETHSSDLTDTLEVLWEQGYSLDEDEAIRDVVEAWSKTNHQKVKLSFFRQDELSQWVAKSLETDQAADVVFSNDADSSIYPYLAWSGKLLDVSDIIEPAQSLYSPGVLGAISLYNNREKKRSYYGVPIHQTTAILLFYWRDFLNQAGLQDREIPNRWNDFWSFWQLAQNQLRPTHSDVYGVGLTLSVGSVDTYNMFEQVLEAYDVHLVDESGQLHADRPEVRQGLVQVFNWYAQLYKQGNVPPNAITWSNSDNNKAFLEHRVILTPNQSLSIPIALRDDLETYQKQVVTLPFPDKPSGEAMTYIVTVKQAVIPVQADKPKEAKELLAYLTQPEVLSRYNRAAGGRYVPVMKSVLAEPFWNDPSDPHISTLSRIVQKSPTHPFASVRTPVYAKVLEEGLWGKQLRRIVVDGISPEQAADEAIARLKEIFATGME